ncbi:MAG TPA: hypothetical protein VFM60_04470 [Salinimicrobium sp.]|nr:hypothetical protein [Salinimicrobium sp.]
MMERQPTLWDNVPLENGYRYLSNLEFDKAVEQFNLALQFSLNDSEQIKELIEACQFWKPLITISVNNLTSDFYSEFLDEFCCFPFKSYMNGLKVALLVYFADLLKKVTGPKLPLVRDTLDQFLILREYQNAEDLVSHYLGHSIKTESKEYELLYLLGQVQWLSGNKIDASRNFAIALIHYPEQNLISRIPSGDLKEIIDSHGCEMAPAIGCIRGILPMMPVREQLTYLDTKHEKAIIAYRILKKAHHAQIKKDMESCVRYRKELKQEFPELFELYFKSLNQRKIFQRHNS